MVYQIRGRGRGRPGLSNNRGRPFRARGRGVNRGQRGLVITLNNRGGRGGPIPQDTRSRPEYDRDRNSWPTDEKQEKTDYGRHLERPDPYDGHFRGESADRKSYDNEYEMNVDNVRGDKEHRRRQDEQQHESLEYGKPDLGGAESLRITVGNDRFLTEGREDDGRRSSSLSARLGPPVDEDRMTSKPRNRNYRERDDRHDEMEDEEEEDEAGRYERKKVNHNKMHHKYDDTGKKSWDDKYDRRERDWSPRHKDDYERDGKQGRTYNRSREEFPDHRSGRNSEEGNYRDRYDRPRYYKQEEKSRDYLHDEDRKRRSYDRDYDRDREHPDKWHDEERRRDRYEFHSDSRRSRDSRDRSSSRGRDSASRDNLHSLHHLSPDRHNMMHRIHEPERNKPSRRTDFPYQGEERPWLKQEDSLFQPQDVDSPINSNLTTKPLKSILKKKMEDTSDGIDTQVTNFLKSIERSSKSERTGESLQSEPHKSRRSVLPGIGEYMMNVDDEETFLYGDTEPSHGHSTQDLATESLFPVLKGVATSGTRDPSIKLSSFQSKATDDKLPFWMDPTSPAAKPAEYGESKKEEDMDTTVQNILKSIGFNFDLSKRMQELAKQKKQKEEESQFPINKNASFLGGGLSSADILFSKGNKTADVESLIREAKESVRQSKKGYTARESKAMQYQ